MSHANLSLRPQVYEDDRQAEYFDRFYQRAGSRGPDWVYDVARLLLTPFCMVFFRARCAGTANVPRSGPVILAPNHFSAMDHFFCGLYLRRRVRFMAKSQLFRGALQWILTHGGAFPVRRGRHDERSIATALEILRCGGALVIYPEGGRSRSGRIGEHGVRSGVGRLALASGAPVVPVAIHGSLRARNWKRLEFPRVTVRYGEPLYFTRAAESSHEEQHAVAERVLGMVRELYEELDGAASARGAGRAPADAPHSAR